MPKRDVQVVVVADDPIEAGMLALDLVQAGVAAQAVRDLEAAASQLLDTGRTRPAAATVIVAAHRELSKIVELWRQVTARVPNVGFVAVVLRAQREAAELESRSLGWAGVAVRPVNAEELVGLVTHATVRNRPNSDVMERVGQLAEDSVVEILGTLIDRIPRPGSAKSATLHLESLGRKGLVAVVEGELVHAEADGDQGRHVLERLCCWRVGEYRIEPGVRDGPSNLSGSSLGLMAVAQEYARRVEEARQSVPYSDCVCTVRWERVRPLPVVAEAMFRRIASGLVLAEALPGEGDDELEAYAALETRIKRGAIVPQIESAPPLLPVQTGESPMVHVGRSGHTSPTGIPAVQMALVDAPQVPQRKRNHPTTNLYRVGSDGKVGPTAAPESAGTPPALPRHPTTLRNVSPSPAPHRTASGAHTTAQPEPTPAGMRKGMVTGWFGVGVGENADVSVELRGGGDPVPLRARPQSEVRLVGSSAARITQPPGARLGEGEGQRLATLPYGWSSPALAEPDDDADADPMPPKPAVRSRWLWGAAIVVLTVVLGVLAWPSGSKRESGQVAAPSTPSQRAYRRAIGLIDAGQSAEAIATLRALSQQPQHEAEVLLQLGVLEAEASDFLQARRHLDAYLALPAVRHADRAKRLYLHVFGEGANPALRPPPGAGGS